MALFDEPIRQSRRLTLTPLIDVVFLLLIFFMLVSTFSETQILRFVTPAGERQSTEQQFELVPVLLSAKGAILIDGRAIAPDLLKLEMEKIAVAADEVTVVMIAEPGAKTQLLIAAVEAARSAGITNIAMKKEADARSLLKGKVPRP